GLELVEVLHVGGRPVGLYRRASSGVGRSAFEEGVAFTREGRLVEARWRFSMVLKGNPRSAAAWARIGEALLGEGEAERAFRCFLRAIEGDPQSVRAHIALADLYMGRGRLEETIHHLKAAARAEPSSSDLNELLTRLEERIGEK
ncbi:MAG: tetratricopeptide repeat protein, partial [Planctomycetota bacterium]